MTDHLGQHPQSAEHPDQRRLPSELQQVDIEQRLPSRLPIGLSHRGDRIGDVVDRQELLSKLRVPPSAAAYASARGAGETVRMAGRSGPHRHPGTRSGRSAACDTRAVRTESQESLADGAAPTSAAVDLYWLPLGAGGHSVRLNGRVYEALAARVQRRPACDLYHSALQIHVPEGTYVVEQTPVPDLSGSQRGRRRRWRRRQPLGGPISNLPLRDSPVARWTHPRRRRGGGQPAATGQR